jgi:hypothetical protein
MLVGNGASGWQNTDMGAVVQSLTAPPVVAPPALLPAPPLREPALPASEPPLPLSEPALVPAEPP